MALTRSRTRNQTTLTKLAKMLASLNGELAFCTGLLDAGELNATDAERLRIHVMGLQAKREALRLTLLQFDPKLDVASIRGMDTWEVRLGRKSLSARSLLRRLLAKV
jgi:hypothetical protein